jgi:acetyl esterase/lipase
MKNCTLVLAILAWSFLPAFSEDIRVNEWLKADQNTDGKLSETETSGLMKRFFGQNDSNKDGFLDRTELEDLNKRLKRREAVKGKSRGNQMPQNRTSIPDSIHFETGIAYREGNKMWKLDLAHPEKKSDELRPGIVIVHGGGWRGGDKGGGQWRSLPIEYAQKGYVAISVNYRLTGEAPFPACVEDVKCSVRWLRANAGKYQLDPERIGAYGNSAGGHLVAMLGLAGKEAGLEGDGPYQDQSSMVQAVCASAPPTDFKNWTVRGLLAGPEESLSKRAEKASPVTYVSSGAPPFLIIHGKADKTVKFEQGKLLADQLKAAGCDVRLLAYDDAGHGVFQQKGAETKPAMEAFFARVLKKKQ